MTERNRARMAVLLQAVSPIPRSKKTWPTMMEFMGDHPSPTLTPLGGILRIVPARDLRRGTRRLLRPAVPRDFLQGPPHPQCFFFMLTPDQPRRKRCPRFFPSVTAGGNKSHQEVSHEARYFPLSAFFCCTQGKRVLEPGSPLSRST